jgi:hypothetical protein
MRTKTLRAILLAPFIFLTADAQDLFFKLDSYFLLPKSRAIVNVLEGTFQGIEGAVTLGQITDVRLYAPDFYGQAVESIALHTDAKKTIIEVQTYGPGTYLLGVSTVPKTIDRKAAAFNEDLSQGGLPDIVAQRRKNNELTKDVRVRYSYHVKAIFQVGNKLSDHYRQKLNHAVELIPQQNPYSLKVGQTLAVSCSVEGRPIGNQFVLAGWESRDGKIHTLDARTSGDGIARFKLVGEGKWYVKMTQLKPLMDPKVNYESKSATLTFAVGSKRG